MLMRINLLPWRDTIKKEREQRFLAILGACLGVTAIVFAGIHLYIASMISYQQARNSLLQDEIKKAEAQIEEIKTLDEKKVALVKRMAAIQELEETRPLMVHLFDELVRKVPDGVYFTSLKQVVDKIALEGVAQSDARVSSLMTNLESSEWITSPLIQIIEKEVKVGVGKKDKNTRSVSKFKLEVKQVLPNKAAPEPEPAKAVTPPAPAKKEK